MALDPARVYRWLIGGLLVLVVGAGLGALFHRPAEDCPSYCQALVAAHTRARLAAERALDSARTAVVHDSTHVTETRTKYVTLRDTLNVHDTVQVKVFVARADSVVKACTELQESCSRFRVRSDSVISFLRVERDAWKSAYDASRPGFWDHAREWGVRALIGAAAYEAGRVVR